jgi:hypothetical protein
MTEAAEALVARFGDQAYHATIDLTALALHTGDQHNAQKLADCAIELMKAGYHKVKRADLVLPDHAGDGSCRNA